MIDPPRNTHRARRGWTLALKGVFLIVAAAGMSQLISFCFRSNLPRNAAFTFAQTVLLPTAILALLCLVAARHELRWTRRAKRLRELLPNIRSGEMPIEVLGELHGGDEIGHLAPMLEEIFRDLREREAEVAKLHAEIRQRVAQRTNALERKVGSLHQQATRDPLTGLGNRRMFAIALPKMIEECRKNGDDLSVLMIDVDFFKKLNDTLGHSAGDQILRDIGQLIHSSVRTSDAAFRLGGDEFVVLMPGADERAARSFEARVSSLVDARAKTLHVEPRPRLSCGLMRLLQMPDATPEALIHAADEKLYEVKTSRKAAEAWMKSPTNASGERKSA